MVLDHIAHSLLFLPVGNGPPPQFVLPVLAVGWTLNCEMYFYALFGGSLLFGRWRWLALAAWLGLFLVPRPRGAVSLSTMTDYGFAWSGLHLMTSHRLAINCRHADLSRSTSGALWGRKC